MGKHEENSNDKNYIEEENYSMKIYEELADPHHQRILTSITRF